MLRTLRFTVVVFLLGFGIAYGKGAGHGHGCGPAPSPAPAPAPAPAASKGAAPSSVSNGAGDPCQVVLVPISGLPGVRHYACR